MRFSLTASGSVDVFDKGAFKSDLLSFLARRGLTSLVPADVVVAVASASIRIDVAILVDDPSQADLVDSLLTEQLLNDLAGASSLLNVDILTLDTPPEIGLAVRSDGAPAGGDFPLIYVLAGGGGLGACLVCILVFCVLRRLCCRPKQGAMVKLTEYRVNPEAGIEVHRVHQGGARQQRRPSAAGRARITPGIGEKGRLHFSHL